MAVHFQIDRARLHHWRCINILPESYRMSCGGVHRSCSVTALRSHGCLDAWYTRSDFARDIGDEPEDSCCISGPSMSEAQSSRRRPSVPDCCLQR